MLSILALFFFACSLVAAEAGELIVLPAGAVALPALRPLSGLLAGTLIMIDRRQWPRLVAAACGAMALSAVVLHGRPVLPGVAVSLIMGLEAWAAAWLVRRTIDGAFALNRVAHTGRLIVASMLVPVMGGALAAASGLTGTSSLLIAWRSWWLADAIGMLLVAPITSAAMNGRSALTSWAVLEMAALFGGTAGLAHGIFGEGLDPLIRMPAYMLPLLLWPVFRSGPGRTSAVVLLAAFIGMWHAWHGHGPFALAGEPAANQVLRSQGAAAIAAVTLLLLASVAAERKRIAQENLALVAELQQALAEVKTLRGFIPICAWCHKVRDDAGFWQQIEQYVDARTDATFSHSICPECAEAAGSEIRSHEPGRGASSRV